MDSLNRLLRERETRSAHGATTGTGSNTNTAASILLQRRLLTSFDVSFTREFDASCHGGGVQALDLDRQQRRFLLSASAVGCVAVYDLEGFEGSTGTAAGGRARCVPSAVRPLAHERAITGVQWYAHDAGMFTTSSVDHTVRVWDAQAMVSVYEFKLDDQVYAHRMSDVASSHALIAAGSLDPRIRLCDMRSGSAAQMLAGHRDAVLALAWSPLRDHQLVSASRDHTIRVWDVRNGQCSHQLAQQQQQRRNATVTSEQRAAVPPVTAHDRPVNGLAFADDGRYLVSTGHDERLRLWDGRDFSNTGVDFASYPSNRRLYTIQMALTSSSSGAGPLTLFHPNDDGTIGMYDIDAGGRLIKKLYGHFAKANCAVWNEYSGELYSGGNDQEILIWAPFRESDNEDIRRAHQDTWSDDDTMAATNTDATTR